MKNDPRSIRTLLLVATLLAPGMSVAQAQPGPFAPPPGFTLTQNDANWDLVYGIVNRVELTVTNNCVTPEQIEVTVFNLPYIALDVPGGPNTYTVDVPPKTTKTVSGVAAPPPPPPTILLGPG